MYENWSEEFLNKHNLMRNYRIKPDVNLRVQNDEILRDLTI